MAREAQILTTYTIRHTILDISTTGKQDAGNQENRQSGRIALITRYPDNHCLVTRYPDDHHRRRYTLHASREKISSHESRATSDKYMQNKAKVKIGKMSVSVAKMKAYDKNSTKSTTNVIQNKAKQSQS